MAENLKLLAPSWDQLYSLLTDLARSIRAQYRPEVIIGVARGGLIPARIAADLLDAPTIGIIGVAFYEDVGRRMRSPIITQPLCIPVEKKRVLVIDDIADTGESLALVVSEVRGRAEEMRTATIYRKPWARFIPDFSARETDAWVVFPWELRETIEKIGRRLLDSGKTLQEAGDGLALAGIDRRQVMAVLEDLCGEPRP
jgi:hypoxanthine phosphoribosyltransferase